MDYFKYLRYIVLNSVENLISSGALPTGLDLQSINVEPPRDPSHGDVATNAALVLAGKAGLKPREVAESLAAALDRVSELSEVSVAGPGFVNIRLSDAFLHDRLRDLLDAGTSYGDSDLGQGQAVNVEYVSANPTGPLHVGNARGAVFGDALANLLQKTGFRVTREYYINDAGTQVDILATLAELAGADIPTDTDGSSILPEIFGESDRKHSQEMFYWEFRGQRAVRHGDWKAIQPGEGKAWELYDLSADIEESTSLAAAHPETLTKMKAFAEASHQPERPGTFLDPLRKRHERDRWAKWGTSRGAPGRAN